MALIREAQNDTDTQKIITPAQAAEKAHMTIAEFEAQTGLKA